jgi:polyribonucleotide nucleotidyltransferase
MSFCYDKFYALAKQASDKHSRSEKFKAVKDAFKETLSEEELSEKSFHAWRILQKSRKESSERYGTK